MLTKTADERSKLAALGVIYACYAGLGFGDAALGVVWPAMREDFGLPVESAGILIGVIKFGGMASSFAYGYFAPGLNIGALMAVNAALAAFAVSGMAASPGWEFVVLFTVPFGMCAGAVSAAVNGHAAKNYSSRTLNWINCAWGVGMTCCTALLTRILSAGSWRAGFLALALIFAGFALLFSRTLGIWRAKTAPRAGRGDRAEVSRRIAFPGIGKFRRVFAANCLFTSAYAGIETAPGLWGTSLLTGVMGSSIEAAGLAVSLYWGSLTAGRFLVGIVASRFQDVWVIRCGIAVAASGAVLLSAAGSAPPAALALALVGLGIAPIYPSIMHDIPRRAGLRPTARLAGAMQGFNYIGAAVFPAIMGVAASLASLRVIGPAMIILLLVLAVSHEVSARNALYSRARTKRL